MIHEALCRSRYGQARKSTQTANRMVGTSCSKILEKLKFGNILEKNYENTEEFFNFVFQLNMNFTIELDISNGNSWLILFGLQNSTKL